MRKIFGILALSVLCFVPSQARAATCTVSHVFATGETLTAANLNANPASIVNCANNLDFNNIGTAGIYASQIIPGNGAQATFGGTSTYTFPVTGNGIGIAFNTTSPMTFPNNAGGSSLTYVRADNGLTVQGISDTVLGIQSAPTGGALMTLDGSGNLGALGTIKSANATITGNVAATTVSLSGTANAVSLAHDGANSQSGVVSFTNSTNTYAIVAKDAPNQLSFTYAGTPVMTMTSAGALTASGTVASTNNGDSFEMTTSAATAQLGDSGANSVGGITGNLFGVAQKGVAWRMTMNTAGDIGANSLHAGSSTYGATSASINGGLSATTGAFSGAATSPTIAKIYQGASQLTSSPHIESFSLLNMAGGGSNNTQAFTLGYTSAPICTLGKLGAGNASNPAYINSLSTTQIVITNPGVGNDSENVICVGQ